VKILHFLNSFPGCSSLRQAQLVLLLQCDDPRWSVVVCRLPLCAAAAAACQNQLTSKTGFSTLFSGAVTGTIWNKCPFGQLFVAVQSVFVLKYEMIPVLL